jgi:sortase (surface protein transpeptidase)
MAAALLAAITLGAAGCSPGHGTAVAPAVSATTRTQPTTPARSSSTAAGVLRAPHLSRSTPTRLQIPAIGVDTTLMALGLRTDGSMQVPPGGFPAGWYTGGPTPGELGPAVIAGHIDMKGPGVFYALHNVLRGDRLTVTRSDGSTAVFQVTAVRQYPKNRFPTTLVYGNIDHAGLRLITCGGSFNSASGHYEDDLVVFADFVAPPR